MTAFINNVSAISPQRTFGDNPFPGEIITLSGKGHMKCIEPSYREFIDPMVARRMSRIVKMGVYCAKKCIDESGVAIPDGIIAGTGLGCLEDTEKFLSSVHTSDEKLLNPTPFIQSTHNTIAGAIALALKCHGYNATYTQRGFSFENALQDALLQLDENPSKNILVGGFDEITETSYHLTSRLGLWKTHGVESHRLYEYKSRGSLAGEGSAFFMVSGKCKNQNSVKVDLSGTFYDPSVEDLNRLVTECIVECGISMDKIDLVILGTNGDIRTDGYYYSLMKGIFSRIAVTGYKYLCGEYDTSASFGLWLAWFLMNRQTAQFMPSLGTIQLPSRLNSIIIYNHLRGKYHSLYHLERC